MLDKIKSKGLLYWVGFAAIVFAITYIICGPTMNGFAERSFQPVIIVFLVIGIVAQVAGLFVDYKFMPLIPVIFYGIAFGLTGYFGATIIGDFYNQLNWMNGDYPSVVVYLVLSGIACGLSCISCFGKK